MTAPLVVGIGGTVRPGSSTERLVRAVLEACALRGAATSMFGGDILAGLPHYDPGARERTSSQLELVAAVRRARAIVIGSPGYHGGVSALVKNAIDLIEDTSRDERVYLDGIPVGLVVTAAGWQAVGITMSALRATAHALRGWPTPLGVGVNTVAQTVFANDGALADEPVVTAVKVQAQQLMRFVQAHDADPGLSEGRQI